MLGNNNESSPSTHRLCVECDHCMHGSSGHAICNIFSTPNCVMRCGWIRTCICVHWLEPKRGCTNWMYRVLPVAEQFENKRTAALIKYHIQQRTAVLPSLACIDLFVRISYCHRILKSLKTFVCWCCCKPGCKKAIHYIQSPLNMFESWYIQAEPSIEGLHYSQTARAHAYVR